MEIKATKLIFTIELNFWHAILKNKNIKNTEHVWILKFVEKKLLKFNVILQKLIFKTIVSENRIGAITRVQYSTVQHSTCVYLYSNLNTLPAVDSKKFQASVPFIAKFASTFFSRMLLDRTLSCSTDSLSS